MFYNKWQVTDKIIQWIFMQFKFNILLVTLTQKVITHRVLKISHMDRYDGNLYELEESFFNRWQVRDKIIEWIFMQFKFNILRVTLTQKIITHRVLKISYMDRYDGNLYELGESFFKAMTSER